MSQRCNMAAGRPAPAALGRGPAAVAVCAKGVHPGTFAPPTGPGATAAATPARLPPPVVF